MSEKLKAPKLRFPGFTDAWEQRQLSSVSQKITEKNKRGEFNETLTNSAEFGIISQDDFFDHRVSNVENLNGYYVVRNDDFVYNPRISVSAPVGPINRNKLGRTGIMSPLYTVFRTHDIDEQFLEWYFKSSSWHRFMHFNGDSGARSDRFSIKDLTFFNMPIPYPELKEQRKIGLFFKSLDNIITLQQRKLETFKKLKKGFLQKMFPKNGESVPEIRFPGFTAAWEQRKLGDISKTYSGGTPKVGVSEYYNGDIPFIRSGEINNDKTELYITSLGLEQSSAAMVKKGDILYALYGATSGEVALSKIDGAINQAILAIIPHNNCDVNFIHQWLNKSKQSILSTFLQGGQGNLSGKTVKELTIDIASYDEQHKIGLFFSRLDKAITLQQRKLESLKKIKQGLLQQMFI